MTQAKTRQPPDEEKVKTNGEAHAEVLRLAREQKVRPIDNIDDLRCSGWPADEAQGAEEFDNWLRAVREEKYGRGPAE